MLASVTIFQSISAVFFALFALLLIMVVLLQRGRGVGLAGAFGGGGGATATFGAKTGDILTWVTIVMFGIYVLLAITLNFLFVSTPSALGQPLTPRAAEELPAEAPVGEQQVPIQITPVVPESATPAANPETGTAPEAAPEPTPADAPSADSPAAEPATPPSDEPVPGAWMWPRGVDPIFGEPAVA